LDHTEDPAAAKADPDVGLMLRVKEGDEDAFRQLFRKHAPRLVGYADRFFRNRAVAEEVSQEVFLKLYRARGAYEPRARFTTWLYTIASRACLNELRRRRARPEELEAPEVSAGRADPGQVPRADEALEGLEMERTLQACLAGMPENQRLALVLTRFGEHSYAEAGGLLGVSEAAVKSLVFRASSALAEALGQAKTSAGTPAKMPAKTEVSS
jgi:RNA polymerase sigma-70 factor (ECF subfamily)